MGLKGWFVGIYASNVVIRTLFLPLLYVLLASPFIAILFAYLRLEPLNNHITLALPPLQHNRLILSMQETQPQRLKVSQITRLIQQLLIRTSGPEGFIRLTGAVRDSAGVELGVYFETAHPVCRDGGVSVGVFGVLEPGVGEAVWFCWVGYFCYFVETF